MSEDAATTTEPLWLSMEEMIVDLSSSDLKGSKKEKAIKRIAGELDKAGYNVSGHGGNMLKLRWAIDARAEVGRPLLTDFEEAVEALTLEDVANTAVATISVVRDVGEAWPAVMELERRDDIRKIVEEKRLALLVAKANKMEGDLGIRYLIEQQIEQATLVEELEITDDKYDEVTAAIAAEKAEVERVEKLIEEVADKSDEEKAKHLISNDVSDENIAELAGLGKAVIDAAREAIAEELKEKQRLAEEEAERKRKEAEGPTLDSIEPEQMLEHIEAIREIMEFSEVEAEIRQMCEQSAIPKALVDIAVSDPDKLDELEAKAEG